MASRPYLKIRHNSIKASWPQHYKPIKTLNKTKQRRNSKRSSIHYNNNIWWFISPHRIKNMEFIYTKLEIEIEAL